MGTARGVRPARTSAMYSSQRSNQLSTWTSYREGLRKRAVMRIGPVGLAEPLAAAASAAPPAMPTVRLTGGGRRLRLDAAVGRSGREGCIG